jgi:hypothetical protein
MAWTETADATELEWLSRLDAADDDTLVSLLFRWAERPNEAPSVVRTAVRRKLHSYGSQDRRLWKEGGVRSGARMEDESLADRLSDVLRLLAAARMHCYLCARRVRLLYADRLDPTQWSLDRCSNLHFHTLDNVRLACLRCNVRRRCRHVRGGPKDDYIIATSLESNESCGAASAADVETRNICPSPSSSSAMAATVAASPGNVPLSSSSPPPTSMPEVDIC